MPFKDGVWTDPTVTELSEFIDRLVNPSAYESPVEMPERLEKQLTNYASLGEIQNREQENQRLYNSALNLAGTDSIVSIIVPIYGALHLAKKCVNSVLERTHWPYELILVDDASPDKKVQKWLETIDSPPIRVLFNKKNRGFAAAVNRGIKAAEGRYVCLLNSDVIVTDNWLTKMVLALEADEKHVIVNPATNNTALINVPMLPGKSYLDMNKALERSSQRLYPEIMPTGFCFMFRKELIDDIGHFDEGFENYGEETSFWFNAIKSTDKDGKYGNRIAVMADDCYVFHERGSSFTRLGHEKHMGMRKGGSDRFHSLHPDFGDWRQNYDPNQAVAPVRQPLPDTFYNTDYKYNLAYVVKSPKFCGGMKFISDIVNRLIENNVNAKVCVIKNPGADNEYLGELHTAPIFFENEEEFIANFNSTVFNEGVLIAAVGEVIPPIEKLIKLNSKLNGVHHIQSYDPALVPKNNVTAIQETTEQYGKLPFSIVSSNWIAETLSELIPEAPVVLPGIEKDLFHVQCRKNTDDRFTILMPLIDTYWFKGMNRGIELAKHLFKLFDEAEIDLRILAYGISGIKDYPRITCLGELSQARIAHLLQNEVDLFIDPSYVHSYGMPSAEALACGVRITGWDNKGIHDVAKAGYSVFDQDMSPEELAKKIFNLTDFTSNPFDPQILDRNEAVEQFIKTIEDKYLLKKNKYKINVVTPHARKHGGPTTIINLANVLEHLGHDVNLITNYTDLKTEIVRMCNVAIYLDWKNPPKCDLTIINSDNPFAEEMIANSPGSKHAMFKLSHNARFKITEEGNLRLPMWDHILCSTNPMVDAATIPMEGWKHIPWSKDKVDRLGWYHYTHPLFNCPPQNRNYGVLSKTPIVVGTLIHQHPLKGSRMALAVMKALLEKYGTQIQCIGIGECKFSDKPNWLNYIYKATRTELADVFKNTDIWINASHTEGLGRLPLELMSASAAIVASDTQAEFLENDKNCLLYPINDAQACANQVDKLLQNPDLFKQIVSNGYETAKQAGNPTTYINNIERLIQKIMEK